MSKILVPENSNVRPCQICGKIFEKEPLIVRDGDLCPECRKTYGGMAFLYCNTCKKIITRVQVGMAAHGYMITPGAILHVSSCPLCKPEVEFVVPEEIKEYEKNR